jgi:hypothetical protein
MVMRWMFGLVVLMVCLGGCKKDDLDPNGGLGTDWEEGVVYFTGEPAVDGCGWLLLMDGEVYSVKNIPSELEIDGLDIWLKGVVEDDSFSCGLGGTSYPVFNISEAVQKPWRTRYLSDYPDRNTSMDMFTIDTVYVDGDSLRIGVGYSGGCAIHQFNLWALEMGLDGDEGLHLMLEHIGNGDPCEAYPHQELAFSLVPIQEKGKDEVTFWMRGSPIMSSLYGSFTYTY